MNNLSATANTVIIGGSVMGVFHRHIALQNSMGVPTEWPFFCDTIAIRYENLEQRFGNYPSCLTEEDTS